MPFQRLNAIVSSMMFSTNSFGLGPLEPLLGDPTISDILVNSYSTIYVERRGKLEVTNVAFKDNEHLIACD